MVGPQLPIRCYCIYNKARLRNWTLFLNCSENQLSIFRWYDMVLVLLVQMYSPKFHICNCARSWQEDKHKRKKNENLCKCVHTHTHIKYILFSLVKMYYVFHKSHFILNIFQYILSLHWSCAFSLYLEQGRS